VFNSKLNIGIVYLLTIIFVLVNMYFVSKNQYYAYAIPFGLFFILLYFFTLDKLMWLIVFFTPLAITIKDDDFGLGVSLPTEPLMAGILLLFVIKIFFDWNFDKRFIKHPLTTILLISLLWMLFTTITSELPIVSIKYLVSRLWFVIPFYFIFSKLIKKTADIRLFSWLYIIPLIIVIVYTTIHHAMWGFDSKAGHWVMSPFYNDHTAYGMILAFYLPISVSLIFTIEYTKTMRVYAIAAATIILFALFMSYSRAAWLSMLGGIAVFVLIYYRIKLRYVLLILVSLVGIFFAFQHQIVDKLSKNDQDSSANFTEHISSASNIATDASNLERINRWACALRLFEERPIVGWGPGTYQFVYAPMQRAKEKTIISTDFGDGGNAHSEYLGPLAEMGILGLLNVLALGIVIITIGVRVYKREKDASTRHIIMGILVAFITYFIHGFLNNFLDSDKASVPFWGFAAILVLWDIRQSENKTNHEISEENITQ
jgi:O-antigen ligase